MDPVALVLALVLGCCCILCMLSSSIGGFWKCTGGSFDPIDFDVDTCMDTTTTTDDDDGGGGGGPVSARYVRLQQTTKAVIKFSEFSVVDSAKTDIGRSKTVTASSQLEGFSLQNLTLGGYPSDSIAGTTDSTETEYVEIDLGEAMEFSSVLLVNTPDTPDGLKGCKVHVYDENKKEILVSDAIEVEGATIEWNASKNEFVAKPRAKDDDAVVVAGRYVKLMHTKPDTVINLALVKVLDDEDADLANGKTTTANTVHPAGPMVHLTDGKLDNFAHTNGPADVNDWMEIDLGATVDIAKIEVHNRPDCCKERAGGIQVSVLDENKDIVSRTPLIPTEAKDKYTYAFVNGTGEWI